MAGEPGPIEQRARHWDAAFAARGADAVSWYQAEPRVSLELIETLGVSPGAAVIDVGGGASFLVDRLVERGFTDVMVLDVSAAALEDVRARIGDAATLVLGDLLEWEPRRLYDLWHDRAVFHFLVVEQDRRRYLEALRAAVRPGGYVILATFAADGPETCSGLPVTRYSADDLARVLGGIFEALETRREVHTTPRGAVQPFTWLAGRIRA